jgi:hypothetical protein
MTRTTKTIHIKNQPTETIKAAITEWAHQNHIKPLIDKPAYFYGQQGRGILTAPKYYEITLEATPDGVTVQTEGWVTSFPPSFWPDARVYVAEIEFTETALIYGGIPRKQGMQTIEKLWTILEAF